MNDPNTTPPLVRDAVEKIRNIATLPEVATKIRELVDDPDCSADDVHRLISSDPALSARILRVVNSSFYGMPGQFGSVKRAIVFLGLNAIKNITLAASLKKMFRSHQAATQFKVDDLWKHSLAVAVLAQQIAIKAGTVANDDAFVAGLIHDVGIIVELQACRAGFGEVLKRCEKDKSLSLCDAELQVFGATHEAFGAELCRAWNFPGQLVDVTGYHHHPMSLPEARRNLPTMIHLADILADKAGTRAVSEVEAPSITHELLQTLGVTREDLAMIAKELPARMAEVNETFAT